MSTTANSEAARRGAPRGNAPTVDGERQASRFRLAIGAAGVVIVALVVVGRPDAGSAGLGLVLTVVGWAAVSALTLHVISLNQYRPWISYLSSGADVAFSCVMPFALIAALDHNFTSGALASVFFLVITLAAVRRGPALVLLVAVASALAYLLITGFLFAGAIPDGSRYLIEDGDVVIGINFIDQMARSLGMVIVGWLVAHVARSLRDSERHYQELFEAIPDGIVITRADGRIATVNQRFAAMAGAGKSSLIDKRLTDLLGSSPDRGVAVPRPTALVGLPLVLQRADGTGTPVRITYSPVDLFEGEGAVMSVRDVTDSTHLERELARAQKLETIGRLAGGLAHDFNNILGGILGAASVAVHVTDRLPATHRDKLEKPLAAIESGGRSARDVVKKLLDFTRTSPAESRRLSLVHLLADVVILCRKTFKETIQIAMEHTIADEPHVRGDEGALKQALLSVCLNAGDSMPTGGRIALRVEHAPRSRSFYARHPEATPGLAYLCATVEDDGPGIDPGTLDEIFDPVFVGRSPAGAPEAGLPTVYRLARQHGGFIEVTSSAKAGTCFRLFLPRSDAENAAAAPEEVSP